MGGRSIIGASSPRVSLARTSPAYPVLLPPTHGEHVEQNVCLATSPDATPPVVWRCWSLRRAEVCAIISGFGTTEHAPPQAVYPPAPHGGLEELSRDPANSGPDFLGEASSVHY